MIALLQAIDTAFAAPSNGAIAKPFPLGLQHDETISPSALPYIVRRVISAPTTTFYGEVTQDSIVVRFSIFGQDEYKTGALMEAFDAAWRGVLLTLLSGQNFGCIRMHAPIPLVRNDLAPPDNARNARMRIFSWTVTYLYSVQN